MIDLYLSYLYEGKITNWLKKMGVSVKDLYVERKECKYIRNNKSYIFLFHGTRPEYVNSIKKKGLLVSMAGKRSADEKDLTVTGKTPLIWFISTYNIKSPGFGTGYNKKLIVSLIAKLDTKFLENRGGSLYIYTKDVPPKDIIWEDDKRFRKIIKSSKCLKEIK